MSGGRTKNSRAGKATATARGTQLGHTVGGSTGLAGAVGSSGRGSALAAGESGMVTFVSDLSATASVAAGFVSVTRFSRLPGAVPSALESVGSADLGVSDSDMGTAVKRTTRPNIPAELQSRVVAELRAGADTTSKGWGGATGAC